MSIAWWAFAACVAVPVYALLGYPLLLECLAFVTRRGVATTEPAEWPMVSITVPAYNE